MTPGAVSQTIERGSASRAAYMSVAMPSKAPARVRAEEQAAIDRDWLKLFVDYAQGDPRLTAWEEGFVASMRHYAYRTGHYADLDPGWRLSHKTEPRQRRRQRNARNVTAQAARCRVACMVILAAQCPAATDERAACPFQPG